jgi:DNA-binding response OmpR family regulator
MKAPDLNGLRVLVVEDESMISMLIEDMLAEMGCMVAGTACDVEGALAAIASEPFDAAIVDINLNGTRSEPVAEKLRDMGTPFVLSTGYGGSGESPAFSGGTIVAKPFEKSGLKAALVAALEASRPEELHGDASARVADRASSNG